MSHITFSSESHNDISLTNLYGLWGGMEKNELSLLAKQLDHQFGAEATIAQVFTYLRYKRGQQTIRGQSLCKKFLKDDKAAPNTLKGIIKELEELTLQHLIDLEISTNHIIKYRILAYALKRRKNTEYFFRIANIQRDELRPLPLTVMQSQEQWWVSHQQYFHQGAEQITGDRWLLYEADEHLETFYYLTKLRYYCEHENLQKIGVTLPEEEEQLQLKDVEAFFERLEAGGHHQPIFQIYRLVFLFMREGFDSERHLTFKAVYQEHRLTFAPPDALVFVKFMFNLIFREYNRGQLNVIEALCFWADQKIQNGLILFEGSISDSEFLNIFMAYGLAREERKLRRFKIKYQKKLAGKHQAHAIQFTDAYLLFYEGKYQEAAERLKANFPKFEVKEPRYTLRIKGLLIKCYFEILISEAEMEKAFIRAREDLLIFLKRENILGERYHKNYANFCALIFEMYSLRKKKKPNKTERIMLREKAMEEVHLFARAWILEKIKTL